VSPAAPAGPVRERPSRERPGRPGLVGPFTGRHIAAAGLAVLVATMILAVATAPIAPPTPSVDPAPPDPQATQFAISSAGDGLAVGDRPPELAVAGTDSVDGVDGVHAPATTLDGRPISLGDLRGRVVWVDFWASWCPPCRVETPVLRDLYARHRDDGLEIVGVSVQESSAEDVRRYVETYGVGYPVVADLTGAIFRSWRVYGLPTQFLLGRDGVIRAVVQGPVDAATAERLIGPLLDEAAPGAPAPGVSAPVTSTSPAPPSPAPPSPAATSPRP